MPALRRDDYVFDPVYDAHTMMAAAYHLNAHHDAAFAPKTSAWSSNNSSFLDSLAFGEAKIITPSFEWYKSLESTSSNSYTYNPITAASITPMGRGPRIDQWPVPEPSLYQPSDYSRQSQHSFSTWESKKWSTELEDFKPWKIEVDSVSVSGDEEKRGEKRWNTVPKLKEIRNLPQRRLCLQLVEDGPDIANQWAIKPVDQEAAQELAAPKSRPNKVLLSEDLDSQDATIFWDVGKNWLAQRKEKVDDAWIVTEEVKLRKTDTAAKGIQPKEWAARFNRREKQVQVGKNTDGYRGLLAWRAKNGMNNGEPQTPRVAELSSKRQFDGRLSHWRILLHAFSPLESESDTMSRQSEEKRGVHRI